MPQFDRHVPTAGLGRNAVVAGGVVLAHAAALWALQSGLVRHSAETIVPAEVIAEFIAPPAPEVQPPPPAPPAPPAAPAPRPAAVKKSAPRPAPAPAPLAVADPVPAPHAPAVSAAAPDPTPPPAPPAPVAAPSQHRRPRPPRRRASSCRRAMPPTCNNPQPSYPAISKRLGEQGKVLLRVFIDEQGRPQKVEVKQSSGYDRLDRQAQDAVLRWRFVPGKRGGVPEAMWNVPINFVLE